jgi:hypothetical protein
VDGFPKVKKQKEYLLNSSILHQLNQYSSVQQRVEKDKMIDDKEKKRIVEDLTSKA